MVWIYSKSFWVFLPTLADEFIRCESFERLELLRGVRGHEEGLSRQFEMVMGLVVVLFHCRVFQRTVHAFHLTIGPGMVGYGEAVLDATFWHTRSKICCKRSTGM
jgi:hypothetical protein